MPDIREKVLEKIKNEIEQNNEEAEVKLIKAGENGFVRDILTTVESGFGSVANLAETRFFFVDKDEAGVEFFVARIQVAAEIPPENGPMLSLLISTKNAELIGGSFGYDPEDATLIYTYSVPVTDDTGEKQLYALVEAAVATSLSEARIHAVDLVPTAKRQGVI